MRRVRLTAVALSLLAAAVVLGAADAAARAGGTTAAMADEPAPPDLGRVARAVLAADGYQKALVPPPDRTDRLRLRTGTGDTFSTIAWVLLWTGVGIAVLVTVAALAARLSERRARAAQILTAVETSDPSAAAYGASLAAAERLAAAGAYEDAVHELLLVAVDRLSARRDVVLPPSLTARELLRVLTPSGPQREPLREIVAAVEAALFGGRALDAADWQRCRAACARVLA
jgi:hypothetical protein